MACGAGASDCNRTRNFWGGVAGTEAYFAGHGLHSGVPDVSILVFGRHGPGETD